MISEYIYLATPFVAWLVAGVLKFLLNSLKYKRFAFELIGYGGLPSNHSAIVSSIAALIYLKEGFSHPSFGVAMALVFIVVLDASSLRRNIGQHAEELNKLKLSGPPLRERMGHTKVEIIAGLLVGCVVAYVLTALF